ncbi:glutathione peroxidase [Aliiruegeria haliotis]|uniref:Glutathione peroxidase n=1 Tax=Aliiruegeria haliotis TaxID=1280846 RepID=A0A2T0RMY5_9RHOB|nr:glutathione peroxidase [Aliiruegeria haliotis]PRY22549.1 glutathione peroxidase [Aliiruegeria haliotis]
MLRILTLTFLIVLGHQVNAETVSGEFTSIDGGVISLEDWRGGPVLVVNTASRCGFTRQYDDLQALHDRYQARGLRVLAVPSNDFRQELATAEQVKDFCAVNFDLDLPMTDITHVRGKRAHTFYKDVRAATGFAPRWNFNKVLVGPDGTVVKTWPARTNPQSREITQEIEALLN